MKKLIALLLAGCMMTAALTGCGGTKDTSSDQASVEENAETSDSDLAYVLDKGVLVVGITDFAPMDYKDENGEWIGFDADMAVAICRISWC